MMSMCSESSDSSHHGGHGGEEGLQGYAFQTFEPTSCLPGKLKVLMFGHGEHVILILQCTLGIGRVRYTFFSYTRTFGND